MTQVGFFTIDDLPKLPAVPLPPSSTFAAAVKARQVAKVPALPEPASPALDLNRAIAYFDTESQLFERGTIADRLRAVRQLVFFGVPLSDAVRLVCNL